MTTLSYSQQQLLKVLQISPVKLADVFAAQPLPAAVSLAKESEPPSSLSSDTVTVLDNSSHQLVSKSIAPDLSQLLAQDIAAALADGLNWQIDTDAAQSQIQQQQLLTPALSVLQHAEQKKALWALLSSYAQGSYEQI
ncbi:hypothetical protein [Rheinheimera sp.]|uniref:hypothetical protein n=1 Tax=Rheinheimera sp. TaxID=1869214 RepID=UPI002732407A|nr:hypothetical protein [Rheinheimera sp.]MDP2714067.1 hypothetical protein [Rheinheimera sp.]